ncbi:hypothetical protein KACC15558_17940 [Brevibacterium ammoniilyticum]|uniref:Uncharacterized protein n=1 Tax=Brevibacterium ammoniilyticum TaxID=1046555 RepID=A0ABP9U0T4_9MICO
MMNTAAMNRARAPNRSVRPIGGNERAFRISAAKTPSALEGAENVTVDMLSIPPQVKRLRITVSGGLHAILPGFLTPGCEAIPGPAS